MVPAMRPSFLFVCFCLLLLTMVPALALDEADQARLEALRQAVAQVGQSEAFDDPNIPSLKVCWTPHTEFSLAGVAAEVPYGARTLLAKYLYLTVERETPLTVLWTHDGRALSNGNCVLKPGAQFVSNGVQSQERPLLPGLYQVVFRRGQAPLVSGQIIILPPLPLAGRNANVVLAEGLTKLQTALQAIDRGEAQPAAQAATEALPLLSTVVWVQPANRDAAAALELANAVVAVGRMELAGGRQLPVRTLDWARRAQAHAANAQLLAADVQLRQGAAKMAQTLGDALPKLREAAAAN